MKRVKVNEMSKGFGWELLIIIGLILLIEYFVVSYFIRFEYVVGRFLTEVPVVSEADKLETYVRSFQDAVELSLLQGIYNIKNQSQELWFDYPTVNIPDDNKIKEMIISNTTEIVKKYLDEYINFVDSNKQEIEIPQPSEISGGNINNDEWVGSSISVEFSVISFKAKNNDMNFNRVFKPSGRLRTQFKVVWGLTKDLIKNDEIGKKAREKITAEITTQDQCTVDDVNSKVKDVLNQFKNDFNSMNSDKKIVINELKLEEESTEATPSFNPDGSFFCQFRIIVKISMEDQMNGEKSKYPVFDGQNVIQDYLGLIYRIRTGNAPTTATTSTTTTTTIVQCAGGQGVCRISSPPANILCASYCGKLGLIPLSCDSDPACQTDECCCICQEMTTTTI
jgi:hypothetical protein